MEEVWDNDFASAVSSRRGDDGYGILVATTRGLMCCWANEMSGLYYACMFILLTLA